MQCPNCGHDNVSEFPFCEECLVLLPKRPDSELSFDLEAAAVRPKIGGDNWPPFPWNPETLEHRVFGRDKTIDTLLARWDHVVTTWTGSLHLLVSEFGMGKNQVTKHLAERARIQQPQGRVVVIRCAEKSGTYGLWNQVIRALFDIPMNASPEDAGEKLLQEVRNYLPSEADEVAGLVGDLVGFKLPNRQPELVNPGGDAVMSRSAGALYRLMQSVSREPMLLVIVQANRASAASLALAAALETALKTLPAMLVLTGSPELTSILPGWERFPCTRLAPLNRTDCEQLAKYFLTGIENSSQELVRMLVERSQGSPWAIKSLIQFVHESGVIIEENGKHKIADETLWELEWPDDLEGVVLARLNTLSARDRTILGHAGVVGPVFWPGALVALERRHVEASEQFGATIRDNLTFEIDRALERLEAMRFIRKVETRNLNQDTWSFRSSLHHRVASTIIPDASSSRFHVTIEQWLRLHGDAKNLFIQEELARHAELSGQNNQAATYNHQAAVIAAREHQPEKALQLLTRADTLISDDDAPARFDISLDLGLALEKSGRAQEALASFHEALHLAWRLRHERHGAKALLHIAQVQTTQGIFDKAGQHYETALRLYQGSGDRAGVGTVCLHLGKMLWVQGRHDSAEQSFRKAERIFSELGNRKGLADVADAVASLKFDRGEFSEAEKAYRRAIQFKNAIDDVKGVATSLNNLGAAWIEQGKGGKAISAWSEGLELAGMIGHRALQATLSTNLGEAMLRSGQYQHAERHFTQALEWATAANAPRVLCELQLNMGQLRLRQGDWEKAEQALDAASSIVKHLKLPKTNGDWLSTTGDLLAARSADTTGKERGKYLKKAQKAYTEAIQQYELGHCNFQAEKVRNRLNDIDDLLQG